MVTQSSQGDRSMDNEFDFGFSVVEEELVPKSVVDDELLRAHQIYDEIEPFLDNLANAKGDVIKWPEALRRTKIMEFKERLETILAKK